MSEVTATGGVRAYPARPAVFCLPDPHGEVEFHLDASQFQEKGTVDVTYRAALSDLIAAGVCEIELFNKWSNGRRRLDRDRDRVVIQKRKTWLWLILQSKSAENALKLPGVTWARIQEESAWYQAQRQQAWAVHQRAVARMGWGRSETLQSDAPAVPQERRHPHLRLVVDNTKGSPHDK